MSKNPSSSSSPLDDRTNTDQVGKSNNSDSFEPGDKKDPSSTPRSKLRKIPPIPVRRTHIAEEEEDDNIGNDDDDFDLEESSPILASSLGLNHIRTKSTSSAAIPSRFSSPAVSSPAVSSTAVSSLNTSNNKKEKDGANVREKWTLSRDPGKKSQMSQSKSLRVPFVLNPGLQVHLLEKEIQSPRFQAILRVTSGRRKRTPADIKSFSHELNSKGVRPFPFWKSRALGHPEEIMAVIRAKFDRLKQEVNSDLGILAGDLVNILQKNTETSSDWKETLEDLLVIARQCAMMSPSEFWTKCECIVQNLDDRRQELPMGTLKQAHTRILFILTRCTRLLQFQKESLFEDEHILGLHQLSDLGVYPEQIFGGGRQGFKSSINEKEAEKHQDLEDQNLSSSGDPMESGTANSVDSTRDRISSWKKLPSAAEKNQRKGHDEQDTPSKDKLDSSQHLDKTNLGVYVKSETVSTAECLPEVSDVPSNVKKVTWGVWGDHQNVVYENSMICRICEVEIPTVHVEYHSRICTIADRCDVKGITLNERLERVAETLERILETCTPKSSDTVEGSPKAATVSTSSMTVSLKKDSLSHGCAGNMVDCVPEADDAFVKDDLMTSTEMSCNTRSILVPKQDKQSSAGSITPRSPLLTPRTSQLELLLSESRIISEYENSQQIHKLLDIARCVASVNATDYRTLEYLVDRLEDLKYAIQDRKVDALIVETFGRRIEKLLQEKYVHLCGQIDDEKLDSSSVTVDEDSSQEDDPVRSLRASPMTTNTKDRTDRTDRTSIEDFEILKPISRGAFGRVFLARKRATGDLFAIKVLKKADMIRKNAVESILAERNILISVRNPFVVRFFYSFTCRENLYLVMEYLNGGDLYSLLRNLGCLDEDMARVYIAELVLALEYLHSMNVIHRDLKPDNILIAHDGHIKLTDFGLSKVGLINSTDDLSGPAVNNTALMEEDEPNAEEQQTQKREQRQKQSAVGTPDYLAPEILLGMGHGATADWWSVGVILFELLVGIPPFNAEHPQLIFDNIMNRDIPWPHVPDELSYEAYDLIDKLLMENPLQRLGATGAREVKQHVFFKNINWDTLARQKAAFIPSAEGFDTSYFTSRYIWTSTDEHLSVAASDFDDLTDCSASCSSSYSNQLDEDGDECGNLADFGGPNLQVKYSFSNFSFKNLSQLASINYDMVVKNNQDSPDASKLLQGHRE